MVVSVECRSNVGLDNPRTCEAPTMSEEEIQARLVVLQNCNEQMSTFSVDGLHPP